MDIEVTEDGLLIRRKKAKKTIKFPYSERDLISTLTPHKAHADELPVIVCAGQTCVCGSDLSY